jgi:hypothetical protein
MMRKSLVIIAVLAAAFCVPAALADTIDNYNISFNAVLGNSFTGSYSWDATKDTFTSCTINTPDGVLNLTNAADSGGQRGAQQLYSVLQAGVGVWGITDSRNNILFGIYGTNGQGGVYDPNGSFQQFVGGGGDSWKSSAVKSVPEPSILWLMLIGVLFTPNRISRGFLQAIRWN